MSLVQIRDSKNKKEPPAPKAAIGIDLGTTYSAVGLLRKGEAAVRLLVNPRTQKHLFPSSVLYRAGHAPVVGLEGGTEDGTLYIRSIKRFMGRSQKDLEDLAVVYPPCPLHPQTEGSETTVFFDIFGQPKSPEMISADILQTLKQEAVKQFGQDITTAVITVPAYFDEAARLATKQAATLAGLEVLRLLNEPTAAAVAYGLEDGAKGRYLVYDLGGGTFDISLLVLREGVLHVQATTGDTLLGGDDMDILLARELCRMCRTDFESLEAAAQQTLLHHCRGLKESLSTETKVLWQREESSQSRRLSEILPSFKALGFLERKTFENLIRPLVLRTLELCQTLLADDHNALDGIILVGGATRIPLIKETLASRFKCPLFDRHNPDEIVAMGAALQAYALSGGASPLLLDVTPLGLGLETVGGLVETIIAHNTPLPTAQAQIFTTYVDGQTAIRFHIVQGDRPLARDCRSLGRFSLKGIPPMVAGAPQVQVTFQVDADGLLMVSAKERNTGLQQNLVMKPAYGLSEKELLSMLRQSLEKSQQDMYQRIVLSKKVQIDQALLALEKAMEKDPDLLEDSMREGLEKTIFYVKERLKDEVFCGDYDSLSALEDDLEKVSIPFAAKRIEKAVAHYLEGQNIQDIENSTRA